MAASQTTDYFCNNSDVLSKKDKMKKAEVIKELQQLKLKVHALEREKATHVYNKRGDFYKDFGILQETEDKMNAERHTEKVKLQQQLTRIKGLVKKFQRELVSVKPTPEFVEKLKVMMEDIESHITDFKDKQRAQYEEMMRDEHITSQEVTALDKRFDSWSQHTSQIDIVRTPKSTTGSIPSHQDKDRDLPPEVMAFEKFLASSGGPRGGWDEYDHGTFLKFRNRHKGKLSFLRDVISSLPTKTDAEIREHEKWYQEYLKLNEKKKEAIQRWKERKEIEKEEIIAKAEKEEQEAERQQRLEEEKQKALDEERQKRKMQLNRWKLEKEIERAEAEERQLRERLAKAEREEKERQKQEALRTKILQYKRQKEEEEEQARLEEAWKEQLELEERRKQATVLVSKYRERDLKTVKQRKAEQEAKERAERERQRRIEEKLRQQVEERVSNDPSRLLQPTAGWKEKQKNKGPSGSGPILHIPHRAIPSWRQDLH